MKASLVSRMCHQCLRAILYFYLICMCGCGHSSDFSSRSKAGLDIYDIVDFQTLKIKQELDRRDMSNLRRIIHDYVRGGLIEQVGSESIWLTSVYKMPDSFVLVYHFVPSLYTDVDIFYVTRKNNILFRGVKNMSFDPVWNALESPGEDWGDDINEMLQKKLKVEVHKLEQKFYRLDLNARLRLAGDKGVGGYILSIMTKDADPAVRLRAAMNPEVNPWDAERLAMGDMDRNVREAAYRRMEKCLGEKTADELRQRWDGTEKRLRGPLWF